jgi:ABC-2 type transport system permease protein
LSQLTAAAPRRLALLEEEALKLPAFLRRDFLVAWSYRVAFVSDALSLVIQALLFYIVGLMVDPGKLPAFGGSRPTYLEFVAVGIALGAFLQLALGRVASGVREEQLQGTLEALLMTPTSLGTIQLGAAFYDLLYVPIRTALFLGIVSIGFGLEFEASGIGPAAAILLLFIPFAWGLGLIAGAATLTFRRGGAGIGLAVTILFVGSGAFFPLELLPHWVTTIAELNPIAVAISGMRDALLGGKGWSAAGDNVLALLPVAAASLTAGLYAFRLALRREQRRGTLGIY